MDINAFNSNTFAVKIPPLPPKKLIVVTAPSGSGKTTLVKRILATHNCIGFSASACTRAPRPGEIDGKDYIFFTTEQFQKQIEEDAFIEWEMVYTGKYYGTLKSELNRIWDEGKYPLIDIDVQGALNIKQKFGNDCLSLFIQAPSIEELRRRLIVRGTETPQSVEERIAKAAYELSFSGKFDQIVINEDLDKACHELGALITNFINAPC